MPSNLVRQIFLVGVILAVFLAGCSGSGTANPASGVENYYRALTAGDVNQLVNASCADWEDDARQELRAFDAVSVTLEGLACQVTSKDAESALVSCEGKIIANYGNEVLEINLADRNYHLIFESGEWRMCGYR
jgi:hypothetical protein